ncbi:hypothetical protein [Budvicia aquatica]|uniref:hypothetical protein n=1 Tax=Budvicia aquatica TaxID=82979 RepID=UPI0012B60A57|nr:hypothetical protein [Budvicia aquatica]
MAVTVKFYVAMTLPVINVGTVTVSVTMIVGVPRKKATVCRCTCCISDEGKPLGFAD